MKHEETPGIVYTKSQEFLLYRVRKQVFCEDSIAYGLTGKGVNIAVLDTGIARHPDLDNKVLLFRDFLNDGPDTLRFYDDSTHGTHVCGIIGGSGSFSSGDFRGIAPNCNLIVGKVLDRNGEGKIKNMVRGIDWVLANKDRYQIKILNISIGIGKLDDLEIERKAIEAVERAWRAGLVVVTAAGNGGPLPMTISPIGASPLVITVGCHDGGVFGHNVSLCENYSGRGPSKYDLRKPDIVAPGTNVISCNSDWNYKFGSYRNLYIKKSGTSMATPIVSGACALLLQQNPTYSNNDVKQCLIESATNLNEDWSKQGAGMLNIRKLLKL